MAGIIGAVVERKSLDEGLQEVGLSEDQVMDHFAAPQNSAAARDYAREQLTGQFGRLVSEGSDLYLVKKVFCDADEYQEMADAVSDADTDKFKVVRIIGSNPKTIGYQQDEEGIEAYLVAGDSPMEALRNTSAAEPNFVSTTSWFDADDAKSFDKKLTTALYEHTPKAMEELFEELGYLG
jgi:hypothetical protein